MVEQTLDTNINDEQKDGTSRDIMFEILEYSTPPSQPTKKPPQTLLGGST